MRFPLLILLCATSSVLAAPPLAQSEVVATPTVPPASADAGKDVVHQLNSAFTKVFELVAPSVVIIEVSKKNDGAENPTLDDLFFQQHRMKMRPREIRTGRSQSRAKGRASSSGPMATFLPTITSSKAPKKSG